MEEPPGAEWGRLLERLWEEPGGDGAALCDADFLSLLGQLDGLPAAAEAQPGAAAGRAPAPPETAAGAALDADAEGGERPAAPARLRCLDKTHAADCALCSPAPTDAQADEFVLRGDAGARVRASGVRRDPERANSH